MLQIWSFGQDLPRGQRFITMKLGNGRPDRWEAARCRRLDGGDVELDIIIICHGCPRKLVLRFRWEASRMKG